MRSITTNFDSYYNHCHYNEGTNKQLDPEIPFYMSALIL